MFDRVFDVLWNEWSALLFLWMLLATFAVVFYLGMQRRSFTPHAAFWLCVLALFLIFGSIAGAWWSVALIRNAYDGDLPFWMDLGVRCIAVACIYWVFLTMHRAAMRIHRHALKSGVTTLRPRRWRPRRYGDDL